MRHARPLDRGPQGRPGASYWKFRVHVPLLTNKAAMTEMADGKHHLEVGKAYKVNTAGMHAIENRGRTPRVHFMFDVR